MMRTGEYPEDWNARRQEVLERDGYECQECGATDTTLQVHHVTPISEGGSHDLTNLTTICRSCHAAEHPIKVKLNTAIREQRRIRMKYSSSTGTRVRELNPYGLAMHEGIQYLVGHDYYRDEIRTFRPTRTDWVELTDISFSKPRDWDTERYLIDDMGYQRTGRGGGGITKGSKKSISIPDWIEQTALLLCIFPIVGFLTHSSLTLALRGVGLGSSVPQSMVTVISLGVGGYLGFVGSRFFMRFSDTE